MHNRKTYVNNTNGNCTSYKKNNNGNEKDNEK